MSKEKIRKAVEEDANRILELLNSDPNLVGGEDYKYKKNHIIEFITHPINKTFVYEIDENIVGIIQTQFWKVSKYILLNNIVVDKNYQRQSIGFKLQNYIEELAKRRGYEFLYLFSEIDNKKIHQMLKKGGYKKGKKFLFFSKKI